MAYILLILSLFLISCDSNQSPDADSLIGISWSLAAVEQSGVVVEVATAGDFGLFFEEDGTRFSHILDPKTGRPVTHSTTSVTVLAENAMLADAWATGLLAMGAERGIALSNDLGIAALFIERGSEGAHIKTATEAFSALQA